MSTNYYLRLPPCAHCGHANGELHIGKSSVGWRFALHTYSFGDSRLIPFGSEELGMPTSLMELDDWRQLFNKFKIFNEYGEEHTSEFMTNEIASRPPRLNGRELSCHIDINDVAHPFSDLDKVHPMACVAWDRDGVSDLIAEMGKRMDGSEYTVRAFSELIAEHNGFPIALKAINSFIRVYLDDSSGPAAWFVSDPVPHWITYR